MDEKMRAQKNIQNPWINITSQNNPVFVRKKKARNVLTKDESYGRKIELVVKSLDD